MKLNNKNTIIISSTAQSLGTATDTEISYNNLGNYRLYGNYNLTLTIEENSAELLANVIADIQGLVPVTKKTRRR